LVILIGPRVGVGTVVGGGGPAGAGVGVAATGAAPIPLPFGATGKYIVDGLVGAGPLSGVSGTVEGTTAPIAGVASGVDVVERTSKAVTGNDPRGELGEAVGGLADRGGTATRETRTYTRTASVAITPTSAIVRRFGFKCVWAFSLSDVEGEEFLHEFVDLGAIDWISWLEPVVIDDEYRLRSPVCPAIGADLLVHGET
jgi:hypothetical protein